MVSVEQCIVLSGGICTLAMYTFLYKENPIFRFFEHLLIGIAAGYSIIVSVKDYIYPMLLVPLFNLDAVVLPDGSMSKPYDMTMLWYLPPLLLGFLYYTILTPRYSYLAKLSIGFSLGVSGGMAFEGFMNDILPQVTSSPRVLVGVFSLELLNNWVFIFTLLSVMYYFFFTFGNRGKIGEGFSRCGRILLMVCFGAFFGSTVMGREALLVERLLFLYDQWIPAVRGVIGV